jgi:hypothetical protein
MCWKIRLGNLVIYKTGHFSVVRRSPLFSRPPVSASDPHLTIGISSATSLLLMLQYPYLLGPKPESSQTTFVIPTHQDAATQTPFAQETVVVLAN